MSSHPHSTSVLPRVFCLVGPDDDLSLLRALAARGVTGFQVRDKTSEDRDCLALVVTVMAALASYEVMVVVDDRLDVALAAGADGVHLGAHDLPVPSARRLADALDRPFVIGATCRDATQVRAAADGEKISGKFTGTVQLSSGKFAIVEQSHEFTLVPWRPVIDRHLGREVMGVVQGGSVSWQLGRQRGLGL